MAFTQTNARLILGYSSMAQLGFITLGIFALDQAARGAQGALLQAVNHGLVVAPMFLDRRAAGRARRRVGGHPRHGRDRVPRAGARGAVPDRHAGDAGDARLGELRRRVPDPARRLRVQDRRSRSSPRSASCWRPSTRCGCTSARCTTGRARGDVVRDVAARRARARAARAGDPRVRAVPAGGARRRRAGRASARAAQPPRRWRTAAIVARQGARTSTGRRCRRSWRWPAAPASCCWSGCCARASCATRGHAGAGAGRARRRPSACASGSGATTPRSSSGALAIDDLTLTLTMLFCAAGIAAVLLSWRSRRPPRPARASTTRCC